MSNKKEAEQTNAVDQDTLDKSIVFALAGYMVDIYMFSLLSQKQQVAETMVCVQQVLRIDQGFLKRFKEARDKLRAKDSSNVPESHLAKPLSVIETPPSSLL